MKLTNKEKIEILKKLKENKTVMYLLTFEELNIIQTLLLCSFLEEPTKTKIMRKRDVYDKR